MYTVVKTDIDCQRLQQALDRLQEWSDRWQLKISHKKCSILQIGYSTKLSSDYYLCGTSVSQAQACKDLGITVDQRLALTAHINNIVTRAHARASLIRKCFLSRDRDSITRDFWRMCDHCWNTPAAYGRAIMLQKYEKSSRCSAALPRDSQDSRNTITLLG